MKNKRKKKSFNPYATYTDEQLLMSIESYLIYKKSCEVARLLVVECCHDSYEPIDTSFHEINFNGCLSAALSRNIPVDLEPKDLNCSVNSVAEVLHHMCGLELTWLDEHRSEILDSDYISEEENIILFYKELIKYLSIEQILEIEEKLKNKFSLVL